MNPGEKKIYNLRIKLLEMPFRPIIRILDSLGASADFVSYLGVATMIGFVLVAKEHAVAGFWLLLIRVLIDVIDGPLARYQKTDSDRGKFVDVLMDNTGFALFIFGLIRAELISGLSAAIFLFAAELVVVLMIIRYNLKYKSQWLFYASAGSFPYNFMSAAYLLYAFYAFGGNNYLAGAAQIFSAFLIFKAISDFWFIQKIKPQAD